MLELGPRLDDLCNLARCQADMSDAGLDDICFASDASGSSSTRSWNDAQSRRRRYCA